jgi:hypothetical protein
MGNLEFERPLWRNVLIAGTIVPLEDPRFMPVVESELSAIRIEVSVLAPPVELPGPEAFDARSQGIIVERSGRRVRCEISTWWQRALAAFGLVAIGRSTGQEPSRLGVVSAYQSACAGKPKPGDVDQP